MSKNTGKSSEAEFESILTRAYGKRVFIHDVTDTAEVRGRAKHHAKFYAQTKAQPCDYFVTENGHSYLAEVKSSNEKISFPFKDITKVQWGTSLRQVQAGGDYFFYLHNLNTNQWYKVHATVFHNHNKSSIRWDLLEQYKWGLSCIQT